MTYSPGCVSDSDVTSDLFVPSRTLVDVKLFWSTNFGGGPLRSNAFAISAFEGLPVTRAAAIRWIAFLPPLLVKVRRFWPALSGPLICHLYLSLAGAVAVTDVPVLGSDPLGPAVTV